MDNVQPTSMRPQWGADVFWTYHKLDPSAGPNGWYRDAAGNMISGLQLNEYGNPATFVTTDPSEIFKDGAWYRLDPALRTLMLAPNDAVGYTNVPAAQRDKLGRPFS